MPASYHKAEFAKISITAIVIIIISFSSPYSAMQEACDLFYKGALSELDDSTVIVPDDVIALHNVIVTGESNLMRPQAITVNGITETVLQWDTASYSCIFLRSFPLTGQLTTINYTIDYIIPIDSIDPVSGDTLTVIKDSSCTGSFWVLIDPAVTDPPDHYPHGFDMICWQRSLGIYYNNQLVTVVNETMNPLEVRFINSPDEAKYHYTKAAIEVGNTVGAVKDKEKFTLTKNDTVFIGTVPRVLISSVANPNAGNGLLQHLAADTLVATFRNNEITKLPLDTMQIKVPFRLTGFIDILRGYYYDNTADGYVDSIYIVLTTDLAGGLTIGHVNEIKDSITLPAFRKLTITGQGVTSGGFYLTVNEDKSNNPTTFVTKNDSLIVKQCVLPGGGWMVGKRAPLYDKIAPIIHWSNKSTLFIDHDVDTISDSLGVKFSEPIGYITSQEPLYIMSMSDSTILTPIFTPVSHPKIDSIVFIIEKNNTKAIKEGDSIWIHEGSRIGDVCVNEQGVEAYNYQNNMNNTRRRLYVEYIFIPHEIDTSEYHGSCSSNPMLAFIPPIGFKIASECKRKKRWWRKLFERIFNKRR